jgi:hypothetical protein
MTRSLCALVVAGLMGFGVALADEPPAPADDTPAATDQPTATDQTLQKPDQQQFMKHCMAKAKAANNGTSEVDMKKACKAQLKANMGNPAQPVTPAH